MMLGFEVAGPIQWKPHFEKNDLYVHVMWLWFGVVLTKHDYHMDFVHRYVKQLREDLDNSENAFVLYYDSEVHEPGNLEVWDRTQKLRYVFEGENDVGEDQ